MSNAAPIRILYMEDDPAVANRIRDKLQQQGYTVDLASGGEQGLATFNAGAYDLLVVNQPMPDGLQLIRLLGLRRSLPPTVMIVPDEKIALEALKMGAGDYIIKDAAGSYLDLLPTVVDQLSEKRSLTNERKQAREALDQRNYRLALLNRICQTLTETFQLEQIVAQSLHAAIEIAGASGGSFWLWTDESRTLLRSQGVYRDGEYNGYVAVEMSREQGVIGQVARAARSFSVACNAEDSLLYPEISMYNNPNLAALMGIPIIVRNSLVGVLEIASDSEQRFEANTTILLETMASSAAIAIDNARLEDVLRQRDHELAARNEELDTFSHILVQGLKKPLNVNLAYTQYLKRKYASLFEPRDFKGIRASEKTSLRMRTLMDDMLLLATIRKAEIEAEPLDMQAIVAEVLQRLEAMTSEYCAEIVIPAHWPVALGQAPWVEEVWTHYLMNGLKYSGQAPRLELGATATENNKVRFWVRDNGPGLTPEQQSRVFTPVTRLDHVPTEGYGLGLAIVQRIVEKLGGQVAVESVSGRGSTFSFTLPRAN